MPAEYGGVAIPKPEPRRRTKARAKRVQARLVTSVRQLVFARDRDMCRCCRQRRAAELHELRYRSLGGRISRQNSIASCTGCHRLLHAHAIRADGSTLGAEGELTFWPRTPAAWAWMRLAAGQGLSSPPWRELEAEP